MLRIFIVTAGSMLLQCQIPFYSSYNTPGMIVPPYYSYQSSYTPPTASDTQNIVSWDSTNSQLPMPSPINVPPLTESSSNTSSISRSSLQIIPVAGGLSSNSYYYTNGDGNVSTQSSSSVGTQGSEVLAAGLLMIFGLIAF